MTNFFNEILYCFHPVGQGLFASGHVGSGDRFFNWVYDCGTTSSQSLIDEAIADYSRLFRSSMAPLAIDMLTISHFDRDHISGIAALLSRYAVDTVLLPFAPLWARVAAAMHSGVAPLEPVFRLFLDPVGYLRSLDGGERIRQFILVPPAGGVPAPAPPDVPPDDPDPPTRVRAGEGPFKLRIDARALDVKAHADLMLTEAEAGQVLLLVPGGRLLVEDVWEFVPYNDSARSPKDSDAFSQKVAELRDALREVAANRTMHVDIEARLEGALAALKSCYDQTFGSDATSRNVISLFLYGGPLFALGTLVDPISVHFDLDPNRLGQLYSGDGYLDSAARVDALAAHLGQIRLGRLGVFQVMHHGAKANWHPGVATRLCPNFSVFSSDPSHKGLGHPHGEVLRDFWEYGACQVDRSRRRCFYVHF